MADGYLRDPTMTAAAAKAVLIAMLDQATRPILDAYPPAERLSWDAKEAEAAAFMAEVDPELQGYEYGLLRGEVAAELGITPVDVTVQQLGAKAEAVLWMAGQWRDLISALSGLRKRYEDDIYSAEDDAGRRAAVEAARVAIAAVALHPE